MLGGQEGQARENNPGRASNTAKVLEGERACLILSNLKAR